jgi:hypothetical protein
MMTGTALSRERFVGMLSRPSPPERNDLVTPGGRIDALRPVLA